MNDDKKNTPTNLNSQQGEAQVPDGGVRQNVRSQESQSSGKVVNENNKPSFSLEEMNGNVENNNPSRAGGEVFSRDPKPSDPTLSDELPGKKVERDNLSIGNTKPIDSKIQDALETKTQSIQNDGGPNSQKNLSTQSNENLPGQSLQGNLRPLENIPPKKNFPKMFVFLAILVTALTGLFLFFLKLKNLPENQSLGKKGEIVWWGLYLEEADLAPLIEEYQEKNPGVKINYLKQPTNDYRERLTNSLAAGNGPDIFEIHNSWSPMFVRELSVLPDQIMSQDEFSKTFYPVSVKDLTTSRGIIAIPLEFDAITLFINEDIFAASARTPPKTWDELRSLASVFTQRGDNGAIIQAGIPMGYAQNVDHWSEILALMLIQNQASLSNPSSTRAKESLDYFMLFKSDGDWDQTLPASTVAFARGKVAMYFGPSKRAFDIIELNQDLKFKTVLLPQLPKERPTDPDYSYATYWAESVWERSRNKDAAWEFLKFLSRKESLENLNHSLKLRTGLERISPRLDMASIWKEDPIFGSVVALAPSAKSWYFATGTYDGPTGINTQLNNIFKEAVEPAVETEPKTLDLVAKDVVEILSKYKIPIQ